MPRNFSLRFWSSAVCNESELNSGGNVIVPRCASPPCESSGDAAPEFTECLSDREWHSIFIFLAKAALEFLRLRDLNQRIRTPRRVRHAAGFFFRADRTSTNRTYSLEQNSAKKTKEPVNSTRLHAFLGCLLIRPFLASC